MEVRLVSVVLVMSVRGRISGVKDFDCLEASMESVLSSGEKSNQVSLISS